jgi:hypothetical protein
MSKVEGCKGNKPVPHFESEELAEAFIEDLGGNNSGPNQWRLFDLLESAETPVTTDWGEPDPFLGFDPTAVKAPHAEPELGRRVKVSRETVARIRLDIPTHVSFEVKRKPRR